MLHGGGGAGGGELLSSPGGRAVPASGLLLREALPRGPWGSVPVLRAGAHKGPFILCGRGGRTAWIKEQLCVCLPPGLPAHPKNTVFLGALRRVRLWLPSWNFLQGPLWHIVLGDWHSFLHAAWLHDPLVP